MFFIVKVFDESLSNLNVIIKNVSEASGKSNYFNDFFLSRCNFKRRIIPVNKKW